MDISTLTALLGTAAGKAVAGTAIAAASVGGLAAADVVELPLLPDEANTVVETLPADGETVSQEASEGRAGPEDETETEVVEEELVEGTEVTGESEGIGDEVSTDAQDGGVEGEDVVGLTPAAEHVPDHAFGSEEPGSQAAEQSQAPDDAGSQADAEPGSQAGEQPGAQADQEPGTQADDAQSRRP